MKTLIGLVILVVGSLVAADAVHARSVQDIIGTKVSLQSDNYPDHWVRHRNYLGEITRIDPASELDHKDSTFVIRRGLSGRGISFESVNYPGFFLRHQGYRIKLHQRERTDLYEKDASFIVRRGLTGKRNSFESVNYPGHYLRHCSYHLFIDNNQRGNRACNPAVFKGDVTFRVRTVKTGGDSNSGVSLRSVNYPEYFVRHRSFLADLTQVNRGQDLDVKDSTFIIRRGLAGQGISFESVNYPGYFLRHQGYRIKLHKREGSDLYKKDASFHRKRRSNGSAFESVNYPGHFLRHCSFRMWIDNNRRGNRDCDPNVFTGDTTFKVIGASRGRSGRR